MHHPVQFNVMAKSIQDDRLRAAVASQATKNARRPRLSWRNRIVVALRQDGIRRGFSWAAAKVGQLSIANAQAAYRDN